jgi:hypothetical protein
MLRPTVKQILYTFSLTGIVYSLQIVEVPGLRSPSIGRFIKQPSNSPVASSFSAASGAFLDYDVKLLYDQRL